MTTNFTWSSLTNGQQVPFDSTVNTLLFDIPGVTWREIGNTGNWGWDPSGQNFFLAYQGKRVDFLGLSADEFASDTLTFAAGGQTLLGDGLATTLDDNANNTITGSDFSDLLMGLGGDDSLHGSQGNDLLYGNSGNDTIDGGDGFDTAYYPQGDSTPIIADLRTGLVQQGAYTDTLLSIERLRSGGGNDHLIGNALGNALFGGQGSDTLEGYAGKDWILGGGGADKLVGGEGNDTLKGGSGHDVLVGGVGNDILNGGSGDDILNGGMGHDQFQFTRMTDFAVGGVRDKIQDFSTDDLIDLSAIDADKGLVGDQTFTLVTGGPFSGSFAQAGELYYDETTHILYGNNDADAAADFSLKILLVGLTTLSTSDFQL